MAIGFEVLAEPNRRRILDLLRESERPVGDLVHELEILAHRGRTRLPGVHHAGEILIPDDLPAERFEPADLPGWDAPESAVARAHGDAWLRERRTVSLVVPSVPGRPFQSGVLINPRHPGFARVRLVRTVAVPWDPRLFAAGLGAGA